MDIKLLLAPRSPPWADVVGTCPHPITAYDRIRYSYGKPFWRKPSQSIDHPVCNISEAEWIKYLIRHSQNHSSHYVASGELITPDNQHVPAEVVYKYREYCPTGLVINAAKTPLIGALTDTYERNDHPLRYFRPDITYNPETKYGSEFIQILADAGFDESEPIINVLMTLLSKLSVPVNPLLPQIVTEQL